MSKTEYLKTPWARSHPAYDTSAINIRPAPEFATAEVVVASTYRAVGFHSIAEGDVPTAGRDLDKQSMKRRPSPAGIGIGPDTWRTILHGALESPKMPNQSSRRFLQLCPIVPDVALYSGSARLSGNSWNPGQLVERMVSFGARSPESAQQIWRELFNALSVSSEDDVWARWLQGEFEHRRLQRWQDRVRWEPGNLTLAPTLPDADKEGVRIPSVQLARDLAAIIRAKPCMTRRQWVSLLEAVIRLGAVAHVLWLCDVNDRLWRCVREAIGGSEGGDGEDLKTTILQGKPSYLVYGAPALPSIKDMASRYLGARLGLNLVLWHLGDSGHQIATLSSLSSMGDFLALVRSQRDQLASVDILGEFANVRDNEARTVSCKRGIGSNLVEFCRYTLGQRQAADENLRGYDQGYHLKKRGEYKAAPWVVSLGPVALLALVHCCLEEAAGPRSIQRLSEHLSWYGLEVDRDDVAKGDLGRQLRMLGLVLDSPDAESGMLLMPPFELAVASTGGAGL